MANPIQLPALSPTMTEGKITKWLKKEGDKVSSGEAVAEVETDKSNLQIESYEDGILLKIVVGEDGTAQVGSPIAWVGEKGARIAEPGEARAPAAARAEAPVAAVPAPAGKPAAKPARTGGRVFVSPLARRIAKEQG